MLLQPQVLALQLVQAIQQRGNCNARISALIPGPILRAPEMRLILTVKVLRLLHEKLRALLPLALQQLLQTLRYGHIAVNAATAEH